MKLLFRFALVIIIFSAFAFAQQSTYAPKAISNPDPEYPAEAASLGYSGTVNVQVTVDKKGKVSVRNAAGPNAPCSNLDDTRIKKIQKAVIEAAKKATFEPAVENGKPIEIGMIITYMFDKTGRPARPRDPNAIVEFGILQARVKRLVKPEYPNGARAGRAAGSVPVSVLVDTDGKIIAAGAMGGHPLLRDAAVRAACGSSIEPVALKGVLVQVTGIINFNFSP